MTRPLPTPDDWVRMPWHAQNRLRHRLATTPPEPTPLTPEMAGDLNTIIGVLDALLTEHYEHTHRRRNR